VIQRRVVPMLFEDKCGSRGERTAVCHPVPDVALWIC
jgi:hypothetical protein